MFGLANLMLTNRQLMTFPDQGAPWKRDEVQTTEDNLLKKFFNFCQRDSTGFQFSALSFLIFFYKSVLPSRQNFWWKILFTIRILLYFDACQTWIAYVRKEIQPISEMSCADLFQQAIKPFYSSKFGRKRIAELLINCHALAVQILGKRLYEELLTGGEFALVEISGIKSRYKVKLRCTRLPNRESVFTLAFESNGLSLYELGFLIDREDSELICRVGSLQPVRVRSNIERIRSASTDIYHIHLRLILLVVLRQFCQRCGVEKLEGIGSRQHVWNAWQYRIKRNAIALKYDEIWMQMGGRKKSNGNFDLPLVLPERDLASYPQKKWNLIRKKQTFMNSIVLTTLD